MGFRHVLLAHDIVRRARGGRRRWLACGWTRGAGAFNGRRSSPVRLAARTAKRRGCIKAVMFRRPAASDGHRYSMLEALCRLLAPASLSSSFVTSRQGRDTNFAECPRRAGDELNTDQLGDGVASNHDSRGHATIRILYTARDRRDERSCVPNILDSRASSV